MPTPTAASKPVSAIRGRRQAAPAVFSIDEGTAFALPVGRRPRRSARLHLHVPGDDSVILRVLTSNVVCWPRASDELADSSSDRRGITDARAPLYVCPSFARDGRCPRAEGACPYVHVPLAEEHTTRLYPHRRCHAAAAAAAAKTSDGGDAYRRFGAEVAGSLLVTAPNGTVAGMSVAAADCLATRALDGGHDGALSLCAHYMGPKAVCDYGAQCKFVHPAPGAQVLRRHACDGPKFTLHGLGGPTPPTARVNAVVDAKLHGDPLRPTQRPGPARSAAAASLSPVTTTSSSCEALLQRFRHDPYQRRGWVGKTSAAAVAPSPPPR